MNSLADYKSSLQLPTPPQDLSVYLTALWFDAKGDWHKAHALVDSLEDATACWVHAYLHRKEGDSSNANYWYRKANKKMPLISLVDEWTNIAQTLLDNESTC